MSKANMLASAMESLTKYVASLPNSQERGLRLATMSPAELRALTEKDPNAMAILTQNGLTAIAFAKANLAQLKPKMDAVRAAGRGK